MKNLIENMYVKVDVCKRCEDEKKVNKYAVLYRMKEMEY